MLDEDSKIIGYGLIVNLISYIVFLLIKNRCKLFPKGNNSDEIDYNPRTEQPLTQPTIIMENDNVVPESDCTPANDTFSESISINIDNVTRSPSIDLDDTVSLSTLTVSSITETHDGHLNDIQTNIDGNHISLDEVDYIDKVVKACCYKV